MCQCRLSTLQQTSASQDPIAIYEHLIDIQKEVLSTVIIGTYGAAIVVTFAPLDLKREWISTAGNDDTMTESQKALYWWQMEFDDRSVYGRREMLVCYRDHDKNVGSSIDSRTPLIVIREVSGDE
nr:hypothetical protein Itr_chr09CG02310 [Ipomoea trifida]